MATAAATASRVAGPVAPEGSGAWLDDEPWEPSHSAAYRKASQRAIDLLTVMKIRRLEGPFAKLPHYTDEEIGVMKSMDNDKRDNRRPFPTWSEVLEVLRALGYRKVAEPTALPGNTRPIDLPPKG